MRDADGIRRPASDEALAVATLWLRSRRAAAPAIPPTVDGDDEVEAWLRDVVLPTYELWLIGPPPSPFAMMVLSRGWVEQLYVAPDRFRQGYGSKLLRFAQSRNDELLLWTFEANAGAGAFYEKHGFVAVGVSPENEEGTSAVRYRWVAKHGALRPVDELAVPNEAPAGSPGQEQLVRTDPARAPRSGPAARRGCVRRWYPDR